MSKYNGFFPSDFIVRHFAVRLFDAILRRFDVVRLKFFCYSESTKKLCIIMNPRIWNKNEDS